MPLITLNPPPYPQATLNKTAQWWVPIPDGHKQRFDYWAVIGKPPGRETDENSTLYAYTPDEVTLAEGWWQVEVGRV